MLAPSWTMPRLVEFIVPRRIRTYPAICLAVAVVNVVVHALADPSVLGCDFRAFYTAGTFLRFGRAAWLYDIAAEQRFQAGALGAHGVAMWLNPPYFAWAFVPLSRLGF